MSRILLLLLFLLWMTWASARHQTLANGADGIDDVKSAQTFHVPPATVHSTVTFLGFYALLVLGLGMWSRSLAQRVGVTNLNRSLRRFHRTMYFGRLAVPVWFGFGLFVSGWGYVVGDIEAWLRRAVHLGPTAALHLPGLLIGTLPPMLAWIGLWWAQFPAERALREHNLLSRLEADLPLQQPPTFRAYLLSNLRLQILFTCVPVLLILLIRDVAALTLRPIVPVAHYDTVETAVYVLSAGLVFIVAPEILRRVLHTESLPASPLRTRLERMCERTGMRYRDILLWKTGHNMGNAAVMGILPNMRYVLLSDLLLETMSDEQIEAVFAHEVGHVVHRHMVWYVVFILILMLGSAGPGQLLSEQLDGLGLPQEVWTFVSVAGFLIAFGYLSRRLERQADVYAARTIQAIRTAEPVVDREQSHVGQYGANVFASALHRVAIINDIPLSPRQHRGNGMKRRFNRSMDAIVEATQNWFHGSIGSRMQYVHGLSTDPALTGRFDRFMVRLYCTLLFALFASLAFVVATM